MQANIALNLAKRQVKGNQNTDKSNSMNPTGIQIGNHMDAEFTLSKQKKSKTKETATNWLITDKEKPL